MFEYTICISNDQSEEIFNKQCVALEKVLIGMTKEKVLHDVDDSLIQIYNFEGNKIKVIKDANLKGVFVESEIELEQFFKKD